MKIPKYIDTEKIRKNAVFPYLGGDEEKRKVYREGFYRAIQCVERAETEDVVPVLHGEWLNFYGNFETAECSLCGEQFEVNFDGEANGELFAGFKKEYSYCPHCGAKMDGKDGEQE